MSDYTDKTLGMHRQISRRDVLHGAAALTASSLLPGAVLAKQTQVAGTDADIHYPPALTGMRGNHDGSFEVAHQLARDGKRDWGTPSRTAENEYDLAIVGAGLSGLAAAHYYLQDNPRARILLLDNHDDFGGHAKRNEFSCGSRQILGYGGSQSIQEPSFYPDNAKSFLADLGVDVDALAAAYDQDFFRRHGLAAGIHFDRKDWGVDRVVRFELGCLVYLPLALSGLSPAEAVGKMPISDAAKAEFLRLLTTTENQLRLSSEGLDEFAFTTSYRTLLEEHLDIREPDVFAVLQDLGLDLGAGIEAISTGDAINYAGLPGAAAAGMTGYVEREPYIHHFPDGNATIARLLVRRMIPGAADGSDFKDIVSSRFDYSRLDDPKSPVRLRLNSTVTQVKHDGDLRRAKRVCIDYVCDDKAHRVTAKHCVLACFNSIIPSLCPELPDGQREALTMSTRSPILYTNVLLKNWRAWKQIGIGAAIASGSYHPVVMLNYPVSFGGQQFPDDPDEPIIVHMEKFPHLPNSGLPARQQRRLGRHELLSTTFETIERRIREQLASLLSGGDFDPARDIEAITVNRWAHGYSDGYYDLGDPWLGEPDDERRPNVRGRKPFGRITIANSDAGASAMLESAVLQAYRAVAELR